VEPSSDGGERVDKKHAARSLVIVSGAPGAGKTSVAVPLAAELGFGLVYKDRLKETLHDALGAPEPDLAWSRRLGAAAMELLWALAADAPRVVIEANFRPRSGFERDKLAELACRAAAVEVYCACPARIALRRYNERGPGRHPVHLRRSLQPEAMDEYDGPVGIGELITLDTAVDVDIAALAAEVRERLHRGAMF